MLKRYKWIFFSIIMLGAMGLLYLVMSDDGPKDEKPEVEIFGYTVKMAAPKEYNLLFGGRSSYLYVTEDDPDTDEKRDKRVTSFPSLGDFQGGFWRSGGTKTSNSNRGEFPTGIYLQWYSLFEKQGWKKRFDFDADFMKQLKYHCFRDISDGFESCLVDRRTFGRDYMSGRFNFRIYAMPSGLAYVYISGGGESYLLGELQAEPTDIDFESYKSTLGSRLNETGEEVFNRRLSYQTEEFQEAYRNGSLSFSTEQWERRMKRYNWELIRNSLYKVKGSYNGVYTNAEMYNIYEDGRNTFRDRHAPPNHLTVYLEETELSPTPGKVHRVRFRFDDDEIMTAFEEVEALDPEGKIKLEVVMRPGLKKYRVLLTNGTKGVRLYPTMFYIEDIPKEYKPIIEAPFIPENE